MLVPMLPVEWFQAIELSWLGQLVRTSLWLFPVIEATHLLGLSALGGAVLLVDLRLWGVAMADQPVATIVRGAHRWLVGSAVLMLSTGTLLFMSEAVKCYHNQAFWVKMVTIPVALTFTFAVRERLASRDGMHTGWQSRLLATVNMGLWFTVAAAGRWIGLSS